MVMPGDEPEYVDDDEYYDPDAGGGHVLGASGRRGNRPSPAKEGAGILGRLRPARGGAKATRPAQASSSAERRARLAGKDPADLRRPPPVAASATAESRRSAPDTDAAEAAVPGPGARVVSWLRRRSSRKDSDSTAHREPVGAGAASRPESGGWLDMDRKLDLLGIALVFGALVFVISALSPAQAAIGGLHRLVGQLLGWGSFALPLGMFALGAWLIIRHFGDSAPQLDGIRIGGIVLTFVGALLLFQYAESLSYGGIMGSFSACSNASSSACVEALVQQSYTGGRGGGLLGGWLYSALVTNVTELGGLVLVLMLQTVAILMMTRATAAEMVLALLGMGRDIRGRVALVAAQRRAARIQAEPPPTEEAVRVSKPQPAQLKSAPASVAALPSPSVESTAFSARLWAWIAGRRQTEPVEQPTEALPRVKRANAFERFLNMGDDIPPPTESAAPPPWTAAQPTAHSSAPLAPPAQVPQVKPTAPPAPLGRVAAASPPAQAPGKSVRVASKPKRPTQPAPLKPPAVTVTAPRQTAGDTHWEMPAYQKLLNPGTVNELAQGPLLKQAATIEKTLAHFGAPGKVVEMNSGPVITQYGVIPAHLTGAKGEQKHVKVSAIAKLDKDLQLALGARSVRIEAPVPGKGYVGIEVPNPVAARVGLRDIMESPSFSQLESPLAIALGMTVDGRAISADLTQMPHMIIAGATNSGKSVCINAIINSILIRNSPATVRFVMIDPKRVELTGYDGLPHLVGSVAIEPEPMVAALRWVTAEMDRRYDRLSRAGTRNIIGYNSKLEPGDAPMPYIVVVIEELADLMLQAGRDDIEIAITRIAAKARAAGIHLVIATQRPSVDVVTGLIKANCPARIAFAVASNADSRVIIDQPGAEKLLGKGDMLYVSGNAPAPLRAQGVHVANDEIARISRFWKLQSPQRHSSQPLPAGDAPDASPVRAAPVPAAASQQSSFWEKAAAASEAERSKQSPDEDKLYEKAVALVRRRNKASTSLLQRKLSIGYVRAARIIDMMEERGVVGPPKEGSSKPRDVLPL